MDKVTMADNSEGRLAAMKRDANRKLLDTAFDNYLSNPSVYEGALFEAVFQFAKSKLQYLRLEFPSVESHNDSDDYAQEVVLAVYENMKKESAALRDRDSFYAWVHKIAFTKASWMFNEIKSRRDTFTSLTVTSKDEDGEEEEIDNPEMLRAGADEINVTIPASVQGTDRIILGLLLTPVFDPERDNLKYGKKNGPVDPDNPKGGYRGVTYKEVAASLRASRPLSGEDWSQITENAVKHRIKRLRDRLRKEREALRSQLRP